MNSPFFPLDEKLLRAADTAAERCRQPFEQIDAVSQWNSAKVLAAFTRNHVAAEHFAGSTGYGYDDRGRDALDRVFADALGAEDALVRHNFVSGTHTIATALFGVLRPGDTMLCCTGKPYDTLDEVIGLRGEGMGSLKDFGVNYRQVDLKPNGAVDKEALSAALRSERVKLVHIQRSRGYSLRPSLTVEAIGEICRLVHEVSPFTVTLVDNCYGEFVEKTEPTDAGADLIVGSLIKNPGGGMAETGGYIAGRAALVALAANRLTVPGMGKEVGPTLSQLQGMFKGLFFAPHVTAQALKTAVFAAALFETLGYEATPGPDAPRTDIVETIRLGTPEALIAFCRGIQQGSPVDSFAAPEPWDMPGYACKVIMAAGAFIGGSSIELSADAPLREPYAVWLQGGLTFETGRLGVLAAAQALLEAGLLKDS